jgi:hypothetical protein
MFKTILTPILTYTPKNIVNQKCEPSTFRSISHTLNVVHRQHYHMLFALTITKMLHTNMNTALTATITANVQI